MNLSEFTCICLGMLFNVLTFALGCAVGVTIANQRKDSPDDSDRYEDEGFQYYREPSQN